MSPILRNRLPAWQWCIAAALAFSIPAGAQTIETIVGNGQAGFSGDGGQATNASINLAQGIDFDGLGNLYISDRHNHRIRKVDQRGVINTIAGTGQQGFAGDGGPALQARFDQPRDLVVDKFGNVFVSDIGNKRIRKISTAGIVTTIAGGGSGGYAEGIQATSATLDGSWGLALDGSGNLYIADGFRVRRVGTDGVIRTIAGNGNDTGPLGDGGPALQAVVWPFGVTVDPAGNVYFTDINRIRRVDAATGMVTTIAGTGMEPSSGDGVPATEGNLLASQLAFDATGNLYFTDDYGFVRYVGVDGMLHTVAGTGVPGFSGDGGPARNAQVGLPLDIAIDELGRIYFVDIVTQRVRTISASTPFMTAALLDFVASVDRPAWLMNDFTRELTQSVGAPRAAACFLLGVTNTRAQLYRAVRLLSDFDARRIAGDSREIAQERDCRWAE